MSQDKQREEWHQRRLEKQAGVKPHKALQAVGNSLDFILRIVGNVKWF